MTQNNAPNPNAPVGRFATPFFSQPAGQRGRSLHAWALDPANLGLIPPVARNGQFSLDDLIGADAVAQIAAGGTLRFHATGDTGLARGTAQQDVADAMTTDYQGNNETDSPAFFLQLGDVIYGPGKDALYADEFYRPYKDYPGKIIAIPGNHDGETFAGTDPGSLAAFEENFTVPGIPATANAARILRQSPDQPGVYWRLSAPFVDIVGLYSNIAEGPGTLLGANGDNTQIDWLEQTLAAIQAERANGPKALIIATHHPPFSQSGHSGSPDMLGQIDTACHNAGILPDALLSGHSHTYQRYTRLRQADGGTVQAPYVVAGIGGHNAQAVAQADGKLTDDHIFAASHHGYGYLLVTVTAHQLGLQLFAVNGADKQAQDHVVVDLTTRHIISG